MFNYMALYFLRYLLNTPAFQRPGETNPISPILDPSRRVPLRFSAPSTACTWIPVGYRPTVLVWWLLNRSTVGFEFRAVGANPKAAQTAGINVSRSTILVMAIAGGLAGMFGGVAQVAGTEKVLTDGVAATYGFDAITVALLGRDAVGHVRSGPPVRRLPRRRGPDADPDGNPHRHRPGGPVPDRAVHRGAAAGPGRLRLEPKKKARHRQVPQGSNHRRCSMSTTVSTPRPGSRRGSGTPARSGLPPR
jgi:hypothetical protein